MINLGLFLLIVFIGIGLILFVVRDKNLLIGDLEFILVFLVLWVLFVFICVCLWVGFLSFL